VEEPSFDFRCAQELIEERCRRKLSSAFEICPTCPKFFEHHLRGQVDWAGISDLLEHVLRSGNFRCCNVTSHRRSGSACPNGPRVSADANLESRKCISLLLQALTFFLLLVTDRLHMSTFPTNMFLLIVRLSLLRWLSRCVFSPKDFQTAKALLARLLSEQSLAPSPLPNPAEKPQTPAFDSKKTTPRQSGGSLLPTTAEWVLDNGNSNASKAGAEANSAAAARGLSETPDGFVELLGEAVYEGRLADDSDRRALRAILADCFSPGWFAGFL
jgi:hypothetical protein